jgi:hypothetical protein
MEKHKRASERDPPLSEKLDPPVMKDTASPEPTTANGDVAPTMCECPPGCVGLPCCA